MVALKEKAPATAGMRAPGVAVLLTGLIMLLGAVASAGGLFWPGLYRDTPYMVAQAVGQDLVTLVVAVPALAVALVYVQRGSARAQLAWIGLLGYMLYTYTTYAFGAAMNQFFLIYVALFSLGVFAMIAAMSGIDTAAWTRRFDAGTPRRAVAGFLVFIAVMLLGLWLPDILRFNLTGVLPPTLVQAGIPTNFVYVMDLGLVVPLALLSATWLWRGRPWGYILAGVVLVKALTLGLALLAMVWFMVRGGNALELAPTTMAAVVVAGSIGFGAWFFRHCRG